MAKQQEPTVALDAMAVTTAPTIETVAVKTVETQVNIQAAEVIQQIMGQMKVKIKSGATSMSLQLNPKELGKIDVQMIRNAEGVSVTFFAEHESTGKLLESQMNQLLQSLKDTGVQITGLNVSQQDQPKQEGGFFKQDQHFGQYFQRSATQSETANKESERPERIGRSSSEVDYLI
jgi:flagellar hook-length control protein FliK